MDTTILLFNDKGAAPQGPSIAPQASWSAMAVTTRGHLAAFLEALSASRAVVSDTCVAFQLEDEEIIEGRLTEINRGSTSQPGICEFSFGGLHWRTRRFRAVVTYEEGTPVALMIKAV